MTDVYIDPVAQSALNRLKLNQPDLSLDFANTIQNTDNRRATNIPNTWDLPREIKHKAAYATNMARLKFAMDNMHRYVVQQVTAFIDNKTDNLTETEASLLAVDIIPIDDVNKTTAYDKPDFIAFIKLLTFFAITSHDKTPDPSMAAKVSDWLSKSAPIFAEMKLNKDDIKTFSKVATKTTTTPTNKQNFVIDESLKHIRFRLAKQTGLFHDEHSKLRSLLGNLLTFYNSRSDNAFRAISNSVGLLNEPYFNKTVAPIAKNDIDDVKQKAAEIVKKHGGRGFVLSPALEQKLKDKNIEAWRTYRKEVAVPLAHSTKSEIKRLVRESGQDKLSAKDIDAAISKLGLPNLFIPEGFNGFYDEDANMYAKNGEKLSANISEGKWLPNPNYNKHKHGQQYIAEHDNPRMNDGKGGLQKVYTWDHKFGKAEDRKAENVAQNTENLPEMREAWRKDMKSKDHDKKLHAHMMEALFQTSSRIGSGEGKTDGKRTYGMRSILTKHVKPQADGSIKIKFPGKSGMAQEYNIKPDDEHKTSLVAHLNKSIAGKDKDDPVWTYKNGKQATVHYIKQYAHSLGWTSGLHEMRHMRANELTEKYMKKHPLPKNKMTAKAVNEYVATLALNVGKALGHKRTLSDGSVEPVGTTALKAYISPSVIRNIYKGKEIPLPAWLEKLSNKKILDDASE